MRKLIFVLLAIILMTTIASYLLFSAPSAGYAGGMLAPVIPLVSVGP